MSNGNATTDPGVNPLIDYWAPRYPTLDRAELEKRIMTDPVVHDKALREYYQANYAESRDYQTFHRQWTQKYGDPFKAATSQVLKGNDPTRTGTAPVVPPDNTLTPAQQLPPQIKPEDKVNTSPFSWSAGQSTNAAGIQGGEYATTIDRRPNVFSEHLNAIGALDARRKGDFNTPGDEIATRNAENPAFQKARFEGRTPYEALSGAKKGEVREFDFRIDAIQDDINNLTLGMELTASRLKQKYGEDLHTRLSEQTPEGEAFRGKVYADEDFKAYLKYDEAYRADLDRVKELFKNDKFRNARAYYEELEAQQAFADIESKVIPSTFQRPRITAKVMGKLAQGVGAVMDIGRELISEKKTYTGWDAVSDMFMEAGKEMARFNPTPSQYARPLFTDTVRFTDSNGTPYQVDLDRGEIQAVRSLQGNVVDKQLTEEERKQIAALTPKRQTNWDAGMYQGMELTGDLIAQAVIGRGISSILGKAAVGATTASRIGTTSAIAGQMIGPVYDELRTQMKDDPEGAAAAALTSSVLIGMSANLFGLESRLAGGPKGLLDNLIGGVKNIKLQQAAGRKVPSYIVGANVASDLLKTGLGEAFEETILEKAIDASSRYFFSAPQENISLNNLASEGALAMSIGVLGGAVTVPGELRLSALSTAINDPEAFERTYNRLIKQGIIRPKHIPPDHPDYKAVTEGMVANEYNRIKELKTRMDAIRPHLRPGINETDVLDLIDRQYRNNIQIAKLDQAGIIGAQDFLKAENKAIEIALSKAVAEGVLEKPEIGETEATPALYEPASILPEGTEVEESVKEAKRVTARTGEAIAVMEEKVAALEAKTAEVAVEEVPPSFTPIGEAVGQRGVFNGRTGNVVETDDPTSRYVFRADEGGEYVLGNDPETVVGEFGLNLRGRTPYEGGEVNVNAEGEITGITLPDGRIVNDPDAGQSQTIRQNIDAVERAELDQALAGMDVDTKGEIRAALQPTTAVDKMLELNEDALLVEEPLTAEGMTDQELNDVLAWTYEASPRLGAVEGAQKVKNSIDGIQKFVAEELEKRKAPPVEVAPEKEARKTVVEPKTIPPRQTSEQVALAELLFEAAIDEAPINDIIDFVEAEGPDWMIEQIKPIKQKVRTLQRNLDLGIEGERTKAALETQKRKLIEEIYAWSGYDEVEMRRASLGPEFSQPAFDARIENIAKIYESKGYDRQAERVRAMASLPPQEGFDIDVELEKAKTAPIEEEPPAPVVRAGAMTAEMIYAELGRVRKQIQNLQQRIKDVRVEQADLGDIAEGMNEKQIRKEIEREERAQREVLRVEQNRLRKQEKTLKQNREAIESAVVDTKDELDERLARGLETGEVKINAQGFFTGTRMAGFLQDLAGTRFAQQFSKFMRKYFRERKLLPVVVHEYDQDRINEINANMKKVKLLSRQLRNAINSEWKGEDAIKKIAKVFGGVGKGIEEILRVQPIELPEVNKFFNELLSSPMLFFNPTMPNGDPVPDSIVDPMREMRRHIDLISQLFIIEGLADGPLSATIMNNLGIYLHRSYRIHTEGEEWIRKVKQNPNIWIGGVNWLIDTLDAQIADLNTANTVIQNRVNALNTQLANLDPLKAPATYQKTQGRIQFWDNQLLENNDRIQALEDRKLNAPAALEAMLYEQSQRVQGRVGVGKAGKLGAKSEGIFEMRGGRAKRVAVREASAKVRAAEERFKQQEKVVNNLHRTATTTKEVDDALAKLDVLSGELDAARFELGQAFAMDIPPELRAVYGEYETPLVNYAQTIYKQIHLLRNARFLRDVRDAGLGVWLHEEPVGEHVVQIAAPSSSTMEPLNGLYTTPEIAEAFAEYNEALDYPAWIKHALAISGRVKFGLTNLSVTTHIRNIESGGYFQLAAGDPLGAAVGLGWYIDGVARAIPLINTVYKPLYNLTSNLFQRVIQAAGGAPFFSRFAHNIANLSDSFRSAADAAFRIGRDAKADIANAEIEEYMELVNLGMVDESVTFGVAKSMIDGFHRSIIEPGTAAPSKALSTARGLFTPLSRAASAAKAFWDHPSENIISETYQASDTVHRVFRFKRDLQRYALAEGIPLNELNVGQNLAFKRRIAKMARDTYPTYSTIPQFFREFAKLPVGTFVSFHVEAVRKMMNNYKYGVADMARGIKEKNPRLTTIGLSRLLGSTFALVLLDEGLKLAFGLLGFNDIPEDEDERDKWRHVLPRWSKNSINVIYGQEGNQFYYTDMGPVVPNTWASQIINDLWVGDNEDVERVLFNEAIGPLDDWDIAFKAFLEASLNMKQLGSERKIYNPEDEITDKVKKSVEHFFDRTQPGVMRQTDRIYSAVQGRFFDNPDLREYSQHNLERELAATFMGIRTTPGDIGTSNFYNMLALAESYNHALQIYRSPARIVERHKPEMNRENRLEYLKQEAAEANALIEKIIQKAMIEYNDLKDIGAEMDVLDANLKATRLPVATLEGIKKGKIVMPELDNLEKAPSDARRRRGRSRSR